MADEGDEHDDDTWYSKEEMLSYLSISGAMSGGKPTAFVHPSDEPDITDGMREACAELGVELVIDEGVQPGVLHVYRV